MKVAVIGANGKAGKRIAAEAKRRGHSVTAIVRRPEKVAGLGLDIIKKDLFELTPADIKGFDAVVSAYGLPFGGRHEDCAYQKAARHLIKIFDKTKTRLLIVGGAASLYTDESKTGKVLETLPETLRRDPADMAQALEEFRGSGVNYTYFSPAVTFDSRGKRTGSYVLGGDAAVKNSSGESYISYEDYAVAMVDEIEQAKHLRARITAASDSKPEPVAEPYYGIAPQAPVFEGMSQYREPLNFELAGKQFDLVFDGGQEYLACFITGGALFWAPFGAGGQALRYDCAKGGEGVYFVNFELAGVTPRTNLTLVMDIDARLVTMVKTITGFDEKYPYMVDSEYFFGYINIPGFAVPEKRHGFTKDLVGRRIHWHYSPTLEIIHVYYCEDFCRVTFPEGKGWGGIPADEFWDMMEREPYDEKAAYMKIRDGLYLVSVMEQNMSRKGFTGNSLLFLIDAERVHDVGRSFGHAGLQEGKVRPENYIFGAFGDFVYSDGVLESKPNVYL
ncbi:MAG: NAD(P)H-binding protein [Clostridiales bacterium]|jgi:putative NADH-flavin reductase|nr:NAD(P)H-binding protein [Clostridiales bacterium]